jgi:hypothetical protein
MSERIYYDICPACGFGNAERKGACAACDNRLFSDGREEHHRYVQLITKEHRKREVVWYSGWLLIALMACTPLLIFAKGQVRWVPGAGLWLAAMVTGWRLIDLKKKRQASAQFLAQHKTA